MPKLLTIENLTNPGVDLVPGDRVRKTYTNGATELIEFVVPETPDPTARQVSMAEIFNSLTADEQDRVAGSNSPRVKSMVLMIQSDARVPIERARSILRIAFNNNRADEILGA